MNSISNPQLLLGTLTVVLPRSLSADRLDEVTQTIDQSLQSEGVGRFAGGDFFLVKPGRLMEGFAPPEGGAK